MCARISRANGRGLPGVSHFPRIWLPPNTTAQSRGLLVRVSSIRQRRRGTTEVHAGIGPASRCCGELRRNSRHSLEQERQVSQSPLESFLSTLWLKNEVEIHPWHRVTRSFIWSLTIQSSNFRGSRWFRHLPNQLEHWSALCGEFIRVTTGHVSPSHPSEDSHISQVNLIAGHHPRLRVFSRRSTPDLR